ncbi:MAG TPA: glycosyltransferase [Planctomycetaceae bacterium]|nr:glycosyltransferase [Planctomycetaceae bacterium]
MMASGLQDAATNGRFFIDHDLTVIVPAFNEERRLPATLDGLSAYLDDWGIDYRVLVVDDGSRDGTARLTCGRGPRFSTISQPNRGKGAAVRNGMLRATGNVVAFTDADLPYDLDGVRTAYDAIAGKACEAVFGARDLKESAVLAPRRILRTLATLTFRSIVHRLVSREVTDTQCGLKVFSRRATVEIFSRTTIDGFAFDAEVVYLTHRLALPFTRIPVTLINEYASTISLTRHALPMLLDVFRVRLRDALGVYDSSPAPLAAVIEAAEPEKARTAA